MEKLNVFRINKNSDQQRIADKGKIEPLGPLPGTYTEFLELTNIPRQQWLNEWFRTILDEDQSPFFRPSYMSHSPTFVIAESLEAAQEKQNRLNEENEAKRLKKVEETEIRLAEREKEMREPLKGWYVVTLDVLISRIKGNDGSKCYSFKILAESEMDAFERACKKVNTEGVKDRNVSFVYGVKDDWNSAFIEFVGTWTDEATLNYGEEI